MKKILVIFLILSFWMNTAVGSSLQNTSTGFRNMFVVEGSGISPTFGDITISGADPALILDTTTATDTDFWIGVTEDAGGDDDDTFEIGKGTTKGTTSFFTWDKDGGFIAQNLTDAVTGYQWLDADGGTPILNLDTTNERVGIGTAAPTGQLHVFNDTITDSILRVEAATTNAFFAIEADTDVKLASLIFIDRDTDNIHGRVGIDRLAPIVTGVAQNDFVLTANNSSSLHLATELISRIKINSSGELSGDPLDDQFSEMLIGDILSQATTPPGLWVLGLTPATTEPDQGAPPASAHDATYNNFATSDQVAKSLAWTLSFFDGGDEYLDVADDAAFSWDDTGANPWSMCAWIEVVATASIQTVIAKYDTQNTDREWKIVLDAAEKMEFALFDEADDKESTNITDAALAAGWHFVAHTYDSTGGAGALSDANSVWYVDGVAVAESQSNDADYTGMVAGATDVTIGGRNTGAAIGNLFQGDMGAVWLEDVELTALQVWLYYKMTKGYYHE